MNSSTPNKRVPKKALTVREMAVFAMLGVLMLVSKLAMEALPNLHLLGALTMTYTLVYRKKALIPIYVYVFLNGLLWGFSAWWVPYLYIWTVLWGVTMLLPKKMPRAIACVVYPVICMLHGLSFGVLYAPAQALMFGLNFEQTLAWIAMGATFDIIHAIGNLVAGLLIFPLSKLLKRLEAKAV